MARFCQFCYSSGDHKRDCPDVGLNNRERQHQERRYVTFEPAVSRPAAHGFIDNFWDDDTPDPRAKPKEREYDSMHEAAAEISRRSAVMRATPRWTLPPGVKVVKEVIEKMPEPPKLIAIDKITGQVYRDLQQLASGCIGKADGEEYFLPEASYDVDFEWDAPQTMASVPA